MVITNTGSSVPCAMSAVVLVPFHKLAINARFFYTMQVSMDINYVFRLVVHWCNTFVQMKISQKLDNSDRLP